ncbi:hypothetical protein M422DRAFT_222673 [Sphaerobolus stellatus SS14]|nr:hypothetical protein M422DRAFT_222673 [Sphaerobolus stellatus SS14]
MDIDNSVHYGVNEPEADAEWDALVPNDGVVELDGEIYTISMFHQLRCLNVIRLALRERGDRGPTDLDRHCLNYLRQMFLCRGDTHMEMIGGVAKHGEDYTNEFVCNDWRAVYDEIETVTSNTRQ